MATTRSTIKHWLDEAKVTGATHVIVVTDTFDWDDYPVPVKPMESAAEKVERYQNKNMQKVMEVYSLTKPFEPQLDEHRSWNLD